MTHVVIEGYLTEGKLAAALRGITGPRWVGEQVNLPGTRRRCDMAFHRAGELVLVEYDGDEHYRHTMKIKADREKDFAATATGLRLVRVPYWVQLDTVTLMHYFGLRCTPAFGHTSGKNASGKAFLKLAWR